MASFTIFAITVADQQTEPERCNRDTLQEYIDGFIQNPIVDRIVIRKEFVTKK